LTEAEVAAPSNQVWSQLLDDLWQGFPQRPASHVPDPRLECGESLRRNAPLAPVIRDAKPQELPPLWSRHCALRLVDLQFEPGGHESAHRGHDPLAGAATANVDVAVIGIAAEAETPAGQFLVEIVKHKVA
jgi:hypothetical protein